MSSRAARYFAVVSKMRYSRVESGIMSAAIAKVRLKAIKAPAKS